jgi:hypothetical protein
MTTVWLGGVIAASDLYPVSFGYRGLLLSVVPLLLALALVRTVERGVPGRRPPGAGMWAAGAAGLMLGGAFAGSQQSAPADTRPLNELPPVAMVVETDAATPDARSIRIGDLAQVQPADGLVNVFAGRRMIGVQPVLTFVSRSPDRCWTLFAPRTLRNGPPRRLLSTTRSTDDVVDVRLRDDCDSALRLTRSSGSAVDVVSFTTLAAPVYSHLNTVTELTLTGHRRLSIEFSPCPGRRIEVEPMDYPRGRPARFAYLDAARVFHVAQATSAEKGPFHDLASDTLRRDQPLAMTFFDQDVAVFRVTMDDWAAQLSTAPSPTAGWGVPVNAIEFSLQGDKPTSAAGVFVTLAATSVGRGFDSVGHSAGTYRNRMRIERLSE